MVASGRSVTAEVVVEGMATGHYVLWVRIRALFGSTALVSIDIDGWQPLSSCEAFCDNPLGFIHQRYDGQRPPLASFHRAFVATLQVLVDAIRIRGQTLDRALADAATW